MLDPVIAVQLDRAEACWAAALTLMTEDDLDCASGCPDWSNRELVNHLVGGGVRYAMLLRQEPPAKVEAARGRDHLGEDPLAAFWELEREFRTAAAAVDLSVPVNHRIGALPGHQLVRMRILELALHSADLSRGTGYAWPVDDALAQFMAAELGDLIVDLGDTGGYRPPRTGPRAGESAADRVLRISGR